MSTVIHQRYREDLTEDQKDVIRQVEEEISDRLGESQDASDIVNAALFMFASWATDYILGVSWLEMFDFAVLLNGDLYEELRPYGIPGYRQLYRLRDPLVGTRLAQGITQAIIERFCPAWICSAHE